MSGLITRYLATPKWIRARIRGVLLAAVAAYITCVGAVWLLQPPLTAPVFYLMPILWLVYYPFFATTLQSWNTVRLKNIVTFAANERHRHLVLKFRRRAIWARINARASLLLMAVSLLGMGYMFVFAGRLLQLDETYTLQTSVQRVDEALNALTQLNAEGAPRLGLNAEDFQALARFREELIALRQTDPNAAATTLEGAPLLNESILRVDEFLASQTALTQLAASVEGLRADAAAVRTATETGGNPDAWARFATVQSLRFGAALVLIAALAVLILVYRYYARLAAHYDARADVIELVQSDDIEKLVKGVEFFSPDAIDFVRRAYPVAVPAEPAGKSLATVDPAPPM